MNNIYMAPQSTLKHFDNLFIELTAKNCNKRCKNCYIEFPFSKQVKDFIPTEKIKDALNDIPELQCIYFTGAEPMTHPDFNNILRLCLKKTNVCIFTNGSFINEKKARFLKKIENESDYEIIFQLSIDHYDEIKNDNIRGRGSYREVLYAIKNLCKYEFNPIICITNHYHEDKNILLKEFKQIFTRIGFNIQNPNFKINEPYNKDNNFDELGKWDKLDCEYSRTITTHGIYSCPFLANDHRGWLGSNIKSFSDKNNLETSYCTTCIKNKSAMFSIDFSQFAKSSL